MRISAFAILQLLPAYIVAASQSILADQPGPQETERIDRSSFNEVFDELVEGVLENYHIPGVSIAIVNGSAIQTKGYGFSILPSEVATPETLWQTGSTTKAFTSAAISLLVDTGALSWTSSLRSILGDDFAVEDGWATDHITVDDAVSHRTGLPRHDYVYQSNISNIEMLKGLRYLSMTAEPRTTFQYCNLMFTTLGVVVERLSGCSLRQFLTEKLWKPLGMDSTFLSREDAKNSGGILATGYHWSDLNAEYVLALKTPMDRVGGAGAAVSTVTDYAKWVRMLLHHDPPLSPCGHAAVLEPRSIMRKAPGFVEPNSLYAAGWIISTYRGQQVVWHNGGLPGFGTLVLFLPSWDFGIVITGNSEAAQTYGSFEIAYTLIDHALGVSRSQRRNWLAEYNKDKQEKEDYVLNAKQRLYPHTPSPPLPPSLALESYEGEYRHPSYGLLDVYLSSSSSSSSTRSLTSNVGWGLSDSRISMIHVSGEYWMAEMVFLAINEVVDVFRMEFKIGVEGKVDGVLVDFGTETRKADKWTWFQRKSDTLP